MPRNLHRKRKIYLDPSKRIDNTTNAEIPETSPTSTRTSASASAITLDQKPLTPLRPVRHKRTREYSEAPGSRSSPSRYHSRLGVTAGQMVNVSISPNTPPTPSLSASRSYLGSSLTPSSSSITGYPPRTAQQQTGLSYNLDFVSGLNRPSLNIPGDPFIGQGIYTPQLDRDILAQNSLRPRRPPDKCALIATEYGTALIAKIDLTVPHCAIFSSAVNKHRFQRSFHPPCPGFAYTTPIGYIPNPQNCLVIKLKTEEVEVETSLAVIDADDPAPDTDIYLGRDFWTKLHSGRFRPLQGFNGLHNPLVSSPQLQNTTSYAWSPEIPETWRTTDYTQGTNMIRADPPGVSFQNLASNHGNGMDAYSLVALNGLELERSDAGVGLQTVRDSIPSQHSPYVGPYEIPGTGNYSTLGQASVTGQYNYALSSANMPTHGFESFAPSGYDDSHGVMQAPNWDPSMGPGTESC
ncbi:hypothetical protein F5X99DRAFT_370707 [Biscogniauxia marginata]|nr:hypothetical protein F5X99DRAFT_370707 [Biscogniauxia marginata]